MKKNYLLTLLILMIISPSLVSQNKFSTIKPAELVIPNDENHPCISDNEYQEMEKEIAKNVKLLGLDKLKNMKVASTSLQWPLKPTVNLTDCGYYYISAFVDLDATSAVKDWNCGARTYNGHRGIDIVSWPFIWDKMDQNLVDVIAAASGTIVAKVDGNPDRVCNGVGGGSTSNNYITIQHADGSQALYVHVKTGSMTTKTIGQTVVTGEFLAHPGSAGQSSGQHLHFEIRSLGTFASYIDPNYGTCNTAIGASWWASQKPYTEPEIVKLSTHSNWPYYGTCPNTHDTTYYADNFISTTGAQGIFHVATKHVTTGMTWNFRILNPNGSVFDFWNYTSTMTLNTSILAWPKTLPTVPGVYTFEGTFNNIVCNKTFTIQGVTNVNDYNLSSNINLYPNPSNGKISIQISDDMIFDNELELTIVNALGQSIKKTPITSHHSELELNLASGLYLYQISNSNNITKTGKLQIE